MRRVTTRVDTRDSPSRSVPKEDGALDVSRKCKVHLRATYTTPWGSTISKEDDEATTRALLRTNTPSSLNSFRPIFTTLPPNRRVHRILSRLLLTFLQALHARLLGCEGWCTGCRDEDAISNSFRPYLVPCVPTDRLFSFLSSLPQVFKGHESI
jgi:hypothetical protein